MSTKEANGPLDTAPWTAKADVRKITAAKELQSAYASPRTQNPFTMQPKHVLYKEINFRKASQTFII